MRPCCTTCLRQRWAALAAVSGFVITVRVRVCWPTPQLREQAPAPAGPRVHGAVHRARKSLHGRPRARRRTAQPASGCWPGYDAARALLRARGATRGPARLATLACLPTRPVLLVPAPHGPWRHDAVHGTGPGVARQREAALGTVALRAHILGVVSPHVDSRLAAAPVGARHLVDREVAHVHAFAALQLHVVAVLVHAVAPHAARRGQFAVDRARRQSERLPPDQTRRHRVPPA